MSQQINLFNPIFLRQKKYFSAATMAQALALILAGGLLIAAYSWYQTRSLAQQASQSAAQLKESQQQLDRINAQYAPRAKNAALEAEVARMQAEHASLQLAINRLHSEEFGDRKGYSSYMRAFARQVVDGLWLTGFVIEGAGSSIALQGSALRPELVPAYMRRLGNEPVLKGKAFAMLEMQLPEPKKDAESKPGQEAKLALPEHINFDLRSKPAEQDAGKSGGDFKKSTDAPAASATAGARP